MGHVEMGGDIMGYQNYVGHEQEKNRRLSPSFNIFVSLKCNSSKFCMLIEINKKTVPMVTLLF